jgi:hypothetical protein
VQLTGARQGNCQRKACEAFGTIGRSGGPFRCASAVTVRCAIKHAFVRRFSLPRGIPNKDASPTDEYSLVQSLGERAIDRRTTDFQGLGDGRRPYAIGFHLLDLGGSMVACTHGTRSVLLRALALRYWRRGNLRFKMASKNGVLRSCCNCPAGGSIPCTGDRLQWERRGAIFARRQYSLNAQSHRHRIACQRPRGVRSLVCGSRLPPKRSQLRE